MATKSYRASIIRADTRLREAIDRTHYVFVKCLAQMIGRYIQMRRGKHGEECRRLVAILLKKGNQAAHGLMDPLTRPKVSSELDEEWVALVKSIHEKSGPLFLQHEGFAEVDGVVIHTKPHGRAEPTQGRLAVTAKFWHQVCDSASAFLQSNNELMENWRKERKEWVERKTAWEKEHADFMAFLNGPYKAFDEECEKKRTESQEGAGQKVTSRKRQGRVHGKRFDRWPLWYDWIVAHAEVIEWAGKAKKEDFVKLAPDEEAQISKKFRRQDKAVGECLKRLREKNPELARLEAMRREYITEYRRFRRPPTLTLPTPDKHPYWFTLENEVFYRDADFDKGLVEMCLIDRNEDGTWELKWMPACIKCDPRLKPSGRAELFAKEGRCPPYIEGKAGRTLDRPAASAAERKAGVKGAKLVVTSRKTELIFTVAEQDCPPKTKWKKIEKKRKCGADNLFGADGIRKDIKALAIDLGIRHIGAYATATAALASDEWVVTWHRKGVIDAPAIPDLSAIRSHDRQLRRGRSVHGRAGRGERSFVELQDHRTDMGEDRFKKAANVIIETARAHNVDIILFEDLERLMPRAFDERWMNRQLRDMNRRGIVERVTAGAAEFGIQCKDDIWPAHTSHVCSKCGKPGWRFSMKAKDSYKEETSRANCKEYGYPIWDDGGHLFRCPHCSYRANSDVNAAGNLVAKFFGRWNGSLKRKNGVYTWADGDGVAHSFDARTEFEKWAADVKLRKAIGPHPFG